MNIKEIEELIEEGESLKAIAQAYSEIANIKIKRIRAQTERNRIFFQEIAYIYGLVKKLANTKKISIVKPKKTISLIITSNYRFYGSINSGLLDYFVKSTRKTDTDIIALGKAAINNFKTTKVFSGYREILLKDDQPNPAELAMLADILKDYSQILVFYSVMKSLLVQQPTVLNLADTLKNFDQSNRTDFAGQEGFRFIFEPDLEKMLIFFDSSIITLLLESTFLESELARTASRFISMDSAETEANAFIKDQLKLKAHAKRDEDNNDILENFASQIGSRLDSYV